MLIYIFTVGIRLFVIFLWVIPVWIFRHCSNPLICFAVATWILLHLGYRYSRIFPTAIKMILRIHPVILQRVRRRKIYPKSIPIQRWMPEIWLSFLWVFSLASLFFSKFWPAINGFQEKPAGYLYHLFSCQLQQCPSNLI